MKRKMMLFLCLCGFGAMNVVAQTVTKDMFVSSLLKQMTLEEKIGQLAQYTHRGNFTGLDGADIPKEEYVRQGRRSVVHLVVRK